MIEFSEEQLAQECEYCTNMKSLYFNKYAVVREIYIEPDKSMSVSISADDESYDVSLTINYCPMCGRKLGE